MTYYDFYSITNGVFLTFSKNLSKKLLYVSHSKEVMDKKKQFYPNYDISRSDYIVLCIYVMFRYRPSSVYSMCEHLCNFRSFEKDYNVFKLEIKHYKNILLQDFNKLIEMYNKIDPLLALKEYKQKIFHLLLFILFLN